MELYEQIAEYITEQGLENTTTGSYYVYFYDIASCFEVSEDWVKEHTQDIEDCFDWEIVSDCEVDDEAFGMWFYLQYCCEHCSCYKDGNRCRSECCNCDIWCDSMEDEDWEDDEEIEIEPTRDVAKAIKNYNLKKIFTGSLSQVPNDRYTRSKSCFDINKLGKDLMGKNFVMVFNHYEMGYACWTVFETPYMDFESIKEIYMKEKDRRLWDSRQLYYDDGNEVIHICVI